MPFLCNFSKMALRHKMTTFMNVLVYFRTFAVLFRDFSFVSDLICLLSLEVSETESETRSLANDSKRRKVVKRPLSGGRGKRADCTKQSSSSSSHSVTREYVPNLPPNASLWDKDRVKAREVGVELTKAWASRLGLSYHVKFLENTKLTEMVKDMILEGARVNMSSKKYFLISSHVSNLNFFFCFVLQVRVALYELVDDFIELSEEVDESRVKISKLTQDLKEVQSEADLGNINLKIAEKLVEQAKQEKHLVELKSTGEKACLKTKIDELETELLQLKDRFKDAL